jgi:Lipopolysaccharide-assembly
VRRSFPWRIGGCLPALLAAWLAGCGYQLAGTTRALPEDVRSISLGKIENRSREFGLEKRLVFAFEQEFLRRGLVRVASDPGAGDAVLSGTIRRFDTFPVSFDANDEALQYQATLVIDLTLRRQRDGKMLWETRGLREVEEYSAAARVVITSSSQFQRGELDEGDLANLSDIQLAETEKRLATDRLLVDAARDAQEQMIEGF